MKCHIDGCDRDATYKSQRVCQKHYFRFMRNGHYERKIKRKYRISNPAGYQKLYEPCHPLACSDGYVYEHRFVYYSEISKTVSKCALCGESINWDNCHIDHIDEDVSNNKKSNLRATCRSCNVFMGHSSESMGKEFITIDGITKSASAWAREDGVNITCATIRRRKRSGMSDYDSVFAEKVTHKNNHPSKKVCKYDEVRGIEKRRENQTQSSHDLSADPLSPDADL